MLNSNFKHCIALGALTLRHMWQQTKRGNTLLTCVCLSVLFFYLIFISLVSKGTTSYLQHNLSTLLGADSIVQVNRALPNTHLKTLQSLTTQFSQSRLYKLTLTHQGKFQSIQLKSVDDHYPVQGKLTYSNNYDLVGKTAQTPPKANEIWLEPRLAAALNVKLGEQLQIGASTLTFTAHLLGEPDRLMEGHSTDMRALTHNDSFKSIHLEAKKYRYLLAHNEEHVGAIQTALSAVPDTELFSKALGNHPLSAIYNRVEKFLGLLSILLIILASITLYLANKKTYQPLTRFIAICMANGMHDRLKAVVIVIASLFILLCSLLPAFALAAACALIFEQFAQQFFNEFTLLWNTTALLQSGLLCIVIYLGVSLPSITDVCSIQPIRLLQPHQQKPKNLLFKSTCYGSLIIGLVYFYSDNWTLTTMLLGSFVICSVLLIALSTCVLSGGHKLCQHRTRLLGFTLYLMRKRIYLKAAQMMALGISLTVLLMSLRIHQDITSMLERFQYHQQGNLLITQADPTQAHALKQFLSEQNGELKELFNYQYAQLTHINSKTLNEADVPVSDSLRVVQNAVRLHWHAQLPDNNTLLEGQWQSEDSKEGVINISVEDEVFNELNLELGDYINMQLTSSNIKFRVNSVHRFTPGKSNITFWFVAQHPQPISSAPIYAMGSAEIDTKTWQALGQLWQQHPTMRLHSIDTLLNQTRHYLNLLSGAVLSYSLLLGILTALLFWAAIQRHLTQDKKRNGLLLCFGLSVKEQYKLACYEWCITTLLPSLTAVGCVYITMGAFYQYELGMRYQPQYIALLAQGIGIGCFIALFGLLATRKQFTRSIRGLLSES